MKKIIGVAVIVIAGAVGSLAASAAEPSTLPATQPAPTTTQAANATWEKLTMSVDGQVVEMQIQRFAAPLNIEPVELNKTSRATPLDTVVSMQSLIKFGQGQEGFRRYAEHFVDSESFIQARNQLSVDEWFAGVRKHESDIRVLGLVRYEDHVLVVTWLPAMKPLRGDRWINAFNMIHRNGIWYVDEDNKIQDPVLRHLHETNYAIVAQPASASHSATQPSTQPAKEISLDLGNKVTMKLVLIPAGKFMMGSPKDEKGKSLADKRDETQHEVTISKPFYMAIYSATQEQYEQIMGNNPSYFKGAQHPVADVTWDDAVEFCKKLSARTGTAVKLPTEAQWEYACRAGTQTPFNTGQTISTDQANYDGRYRFDDDWVEDKTGVHRDQTTPVGSFKPNAWGLYDMHGNVWQWCSDWYGEIPAGAVTDPTGPADGDQHVFRGGCYQAFVWTCRSAYRCGIPSGGRYTGGGGYFGFRVVVAVPAAPAN